jgi:hypothetical protein
MDGTCGKKPGNMDGKGSVQAAREAAGQTKKLRLDTSKLKNSSFSSIAVAKRMDGTYGCWVDVFIDNIKGIKSI